MKRIIRTSLKTFFFTAGRFSIKHMFFFCLFIALPGVVLSQEMERPLQSNPILKKMPSNPLKDAIINPDSFAISRYVVVDNKMVLVGDTLRFFDDFSNYYSIKNNIETWNYYPDQRLWEDSTVFINTTFASFIDSTFASSPPSIGTATFDALDQHGQLYPGQEGMTILADSLTSRPIRFLDTDSVYLSFYYQPGGLGDIPDWQDSLVLEFYNPLTFAWSSQWSSPDTTPASKFKLVLIHITGDYLNDRFQFKFKNYITYSSGNVDPGRITNCDIWNLDYVYLRANRNPGDTIFRDITFVDPYESLLTNFESMPWKHYTSSVQRAELSATMRNHIKNLGDTVVSIVKNYTLNYPGLNKDTVTDTTTWTVGFNSPYFGAIRDTVVYDPVYSLYTCDTYPDSVDSVTIQLQSVITGYGYENKIDFVKANDTVYYDQIFSNYYAYDDGSAEMG